PANGPAARLVSALVFRSAGADTAENGGLRDDSRADHRRSATTGTGIEQSRRTRAFAPAVVHRDDDAKCDHDRFALDCRLAIAVVAQFQARAVDSGDYRDDEWTCLPGRAIISR